MKNNIALFNDDQSLFDNLAKSLKGATGKKLMVLEGHVIQEDEGIIARFRNTTEAANCLRQAGFTEDYTEETLPEQDTLWGSFWVSK